jgi:glucosylceramidase
MSIKITIRKDLPLGTWQGLGGAITEATAYNFSKLSKEKRKELIEAYYGKNGLDYRWGRISIGSNDFCLSPYEYTHRASLRDFSILHDRRWVLKMLKMALEKQNLQLIASPWSPPACLKTTHMKRFGGHLKPWRYRTYARYIRKWLDAYREEGVKFRYLTPQNEPQAIQVWESCVYSFRAQRRLAYKYLAPALDGIDTQILLWDHNKKNLIEVADQLLTEVNPKVAGLCYHWYDGTHPEQMWAVRQKYPDIVMLSSEMCVGFSPYDPADWATAANPYYYEIMSDINTGATAFIDWNMLLDWHGGPTYCANYVKSPVILNEAGNDFILTPIYYALKKFAQLYPAGSMIIRCDYDSKDVAAVARKTKSGHEVVIANVSGSEQEIEIKLGRTKKSLKLAPLEIEKITI